MDARDFRLLNDFQHDFPLVAEPWAVIAATLGCGAEEIVARLMRLQRSGGLGRVGAVFAPNRLGASTLAALAVPEADIARVAALVNAFPGVNHNYRREHRYSLWFVASAADEAPLAALLDEIATAAGYAPIALPLVEEFHIDLGFRLDADSAPRPLRPAVYPPAGRMALSAAEWRLVAALHEGLAWVPRPFELLAEACGLREDEVLETLKRWRAEGGLKRFGVVVKHRALGYTANAMCVWDVPDVVASALGQRLGRCAGVTLCYRRRPMGDWPYRLFCMIHGHSRDAVEARRAAIAAETGLDTYPSAVLFSTECFKQCGARYMAPAECAA